MTHPEQVWLDNPRHGVTTSVYVEEKAPNEQTVQYVRADIVEKYLERIEEFEEQCGMFERQRDNLADRCEELEKFERMVEEYQDAICSFECEVGNIGL